mgnify:CR=1 FL=1
MDRDKGWQKQDGMGNREQDVPTTEISHSYYRYKKMCQRIYRNTRIKKIGLEDATFKSNS